MTEIVNFSNLTPRQSKFYDKCAANIIDEYNCIVSDIYSLNKDNKNWYFSTVASRSPHRSKLFRRMCILYFINKYKPLEKETLLYEINDKTLYKIFRNKNFENIIYKNETKTFIDYFVRLNKLFCYSVCVFALYIVSRLFGRLKVDTKPTVLLETFIYGIGDSAGTINEKIYKDRYFPGLFDILKSKDILTYYLPTILYKGNFVKTLIKSLIIEDFIIKEKYLKIEDFIAILRLPFQKITLPQKILFRNFDIYNLVRNELKLNQFDSSKLVAGINSIFPKRLCEKGVEVSILLDCYENQVIDRALMRGFRLYSPKTLIVGCQGFIVCPISNFYLYPIPVEKKLNFSPHIIAVNGTLFLSDIKTETDIETLVLPSFRYKSIFNERKYYPEKNKLTIFFPFEYNFEKSISNYKLLIIALKSINAKSKILIIVQLHPTHLLKKVDFLFSGKNIESIISTEVFSLAVQKANIVVGSASSALVESLVYCPSVLIIANNSGITANPIPNLLNRNYHVCYDSNDLSNEIMKLRTNTVDLLSNNVKNMLFLEPTINESLKFVSKLLSKHNEINQYIET